MPKERIRAVTGLLEKEGVAVDINAYRDMYPGIRLWGGPTVEADDTAALLEWLAYAVATVK
jgi:phosphoserine aminotransferase